MKKIIAIIICVATMLSLALIPSNAITNNFLDSGVDLISDDEEYNCSWTSDDEKFEVFLKVKTTGFYDLYAQDNYGASYNLSFDIFDASKEGDKNVYKYYDSGYCSMDGSDFNAFSNIYLVKNKLYKIVISSSYYNADYKDYIYEGGSVSFAFIANSYSPSALSSTYSQIALASNKTNRYIVKTNKAGDYQLTFSKAVSYDYENDFVFIELFDMSSMKMEQIYFPAESIKTAKFNLSANKTYTLLISSPETTTVVDVKFTKCSKDIKKISVAKQPTIYQDDNFYDDDFSYLITYSDGSKETLAYSKINFDLDVTYKGKYADSAKEFYKTGTQTVAIDCFHSGFAYKKTFSSSIKITPLYDYINSSAVGTETTTFRYLNNGSKEWQSGLWKVKISDTNLYGLYSEDWDEIGEYYIDFFTSDGKYVEYKNDGWALASGKEYVLRFKACFDEDYDEDFYFTIEPDRDHSHTYKNVTTPATLTANGKIQSKCSVCNHVNPSKKTQVIYKIKTVKLSSTTYTYTGKTITPSVTVKDSNGNTLKKNTDYTVTYASDRKNIGTYKVTVNFKGKYSGSKTLTFKITPAQVKITSASMSSSYKVSMKWNKVQYASKYQVYYYDNKAKTYKSDGTTSKTSFSQTWKGWSQVTFKVRAVCMNGSKVVAYGPWSSPVTVKRK